MKCELCSKEFVNLSNLTKHFQFCKNKNEFVAKDYYDKFLTSNPSPKCYCGNDIPFKNLSAGYSKYCSLTCCNKDPDRKNKIRNTNIERFGGPAPLCDPEILSKARHTLEEKWGVTAPTKHPDIMTKIKETTMKRYQCINVSQSETELK